MRAFASSSSRSPRIPPVGLERFLIEFDAEPGRLGNGEKPVSRDERLSEKLPPKRVLGDVELLIGRIGLGDEKVERGADENVGGPAMRDYAHVSYLG